ncbi:MBL fold metallo-hydrolase [bacterium]|nr:MBL fold metallo-hydrolase [bacterium]
MKLTFLGAARTVTGSQMLLETAGKRILIDAGMHQGPEHFRQQGRPDFHLDYSQVDMLLLTHAHIDHSGNLPLITRLGFKGPVYTTSATADLCQVMLPDSAHIQEEDWKHDHRRWLAQGRIGPPPAPLYGMEDVERALKLFRPVQYEQTVELAPGIKARWRDAGHILGAAGIEVWVAENGRTTKLLFSGDIGQADRPLLRDPSVYDEADFVVMESTYGNRRHEAKHVQQSVLQDILKYVARNRSHVIIPAFAVGRVQELLYTLNGIIEHNLAPRMPVFVDSPLAISATEISERHAECFDDETRALLARGDDPMSFPGLKLTRTVQESKAINRMAGPLMVIASSGMCTGGRIRHHLQNHLDHGKDILLFVGYQAAGTLGRYLLDGNPQVKLFGEKVRVRTRIRSLSAFSAHADVDGLLQWLAPIKGPGGASGPKAVFVEHGEEDAALDFAALAHRELGAPTLVPEFGETFDLSSPDETERRLGEMGEIWQRPAEITSASEGGDEEEEPPITAPAVQ